MIHSFPLPLSLYFQFVSKQRSRSLEITCRLLISLPGLSFHATIHGMCFFNCVYIHIYLFKGMSYAWALRSVIHGMIFFFFFPLIQRYLLFRFSTLWELNWVTVHLTCLLLSPKNVNNTVTVNTMYSIRPWFVVHVLELHIMNKHMGALFKGKKKVKLIGYSVFME